MNNIRDAKTREESERSTGEKIRRLTMQNPIVYDAFQRVANKREVRVDQLSPSGRTRALELALIALAERNQKLMDKLEDSAARQAGPVTSLGQNPNEQT
jgi:hypothetical protein